VRECGVLDRRRRAESIRRGTAQFLDPGETVMHVVEVGAGRVKGSAEIMVGDFPATFVSQRPARFYGLIATDRNLYAVRLGGERHATPEGVLLKSAIGRVSVRRNGKMIYVRADAETPERGFEVSSLSGKRAKNLVEYVSQQV
jgi:hypothetical protein